MLGMLSTYWNSTSRQLREIKGTRYSTNKCEREIKENNDNNNIER